MTYTGIDYHKRYSVASSQNAKGARLSEAKIDGNAPEAFKTYFKALPGPHEVVIAHLKGVKLCTLHATAFLFTSIRPE